MITLATYIAKGNTRSINQEGLSILKALPRPVVDRMLGNLKNGLQDVDNSDHRRMEQLLRDVQ